MAILNFLVMESILALQRVRSIYPSSRISNISFFLEMDHLIARL